MLIPLVIAWARVALAALVLLEERSR